METSKIAGNGEAAEESELWFSSGRLLPEDEQVASELSPGRNKGRCKTYISLYGAESL